MKDSNQWLLSGERLRRMFRADAPVRDRERELARLRLRLGLALAAFYCLLVGLFMAYGLAWPRAVLIVTFVVGLGFLLGRSLSGR